MLQNNDGLEYEFRFKMGRKVPEERQVALSSQPHNVIMDSFVTQTKEHVIHSNQNMDKSKLIQRHPQPTIKDKRHTIQPHKAGHFPFKLNKYSKRQLNEKKRKVNVTDFQNSHHNLMQKLKNSEQRVLQKIREVIPEELITIRSIALDQSLNKLKSSKKHRLSKSSQIQSQQSSLNKRVQFADSKNNIQKNSFESTKSIFDTTKFIENQEKQQGQQYFRNISRKMEGQKEIQKIKRVNSNCYYSNLKKKLKHEIYKIQEQKEIDQKKFLIEGCNIEKHKRSMIQNFKPSLTQRLRPRTAVSKVGLSIKKSHDSLLDSKSQRNCNSQSRRRLRNQTERQQIQYINKNRMDYSIVQEMKTDRPTIKRAQSATSKRQYAHSRQPSKIAQFGRTFSHISPKSKQNHLNASKSEIKHQMLKEKMLNILVDCQEQRQKNLTIQNGFKVFEFYCKKMDEGLERANYKLVSEIQRTIDEKE